MMYVSAYNPAQTALAQQQGMQSGQGISHGFPIASSMSPMAFAGQQGLQSGFSPMQSFVDPMRTAVTYSFNPMGTGVGMQSMGMGMGSQGQSGMGTGWSGGWTSTLHSTSGITQPRVDIAETNSDVIVTAELPNINTNELYLTVTEDSLSLSCNAFAGGTQTSVHRTVALPTSVRSERVEASYSNGILEARLPKSDATTRRRVKVSTTSG